MTVQTKLCQNGGKKYLAKKATFQLFSSISGFGDLIVQPEFCQSVHTIRLSFIQLVVVINQQICTNLNCERYQKNGVSVSTEN